MVELKINSSSDRDKVVLGLVNSGYMVRVVEKDHPKHMFQKEYFVQVEN